MIHANSMEAFTAEQDKLGRRAREILDHLNTNGAKTDREVMNDLGYSEPNAVRPRITELVRKGLARECGKERCPVTNRHVRLVKAVEPETVNPDQMEFAWA